MNILFLSVGLSDMNNPSGLYDDLIKKLITDGHKVSAVAPCLADNYVGLRSEGGVEVVRVKTGKFRNQANMLKKGAAVFALGFQYKSVIKRYFWKEKFDIVFLPTPPSSLVDVALMVKQHTGARLYVILRDIHPECFKRDVVSKTIQDNPSLYDECKKPYMINPIMYKYLYWKSQRLYKNADYIGCMSPGNMAYIHSIAPKVDKDKIVLLPNWYTGNERKEIDEDALREKYGLKDKFVAIFGGTIGPAQAVWNIATLAKHFINRQDVVFLVVGRGPKKQVLADMANKDNLTNIKMLEYMPREDYQAILNLADVGIISIDEKYPVPTSPSKIIGYMALHKPVLAMFNEGNDYGEFYLDKPECGLWSVGQDNEKMFQNLEWFYTHPQERKKMGENGYQYYKTHFTVDAVYELLNEQLRNE